MTKSDKNAVYADNGVITGAKRVRLADIGMVLISGTKQG
jgi:hypothetical protein